MPLITRAILASAALLLTATVGRAQQDAAASPGGTASSTRSVATVRQVMTALTIPYSDAIFDAQSEPPKSEDQWTKVSASALVLAEAGNLLMIGSRAKDKEGWMTMARAQVDAAETVMRAANARDLDALSTTADALYTTCNACHARYMNSR
jgi:hypothetical protein